MAPEIEMHGGGKWTGDADAEVGRLNRTPLYMPL